MKMGKQGFTMIELLVVLLIIGILAAVAAPLLLGNSERARASEAVAAMGMIRQAERQHFSKYNAFLDVDQAAIALASPAGLGVNVAPAKFFCQDSYTIDVGATPTSTLGMTNPVDFVITATGSACTSSDPTAANGSRDPGAVSTMVVEMDNSGHTIYSVVAGTTVEY